MNSNDFNQTDRSGSPDANTVKLYVDHLKNLLAQSREQLQDYKKQIEIYRAEIESMRHQLDTLNSDNVAHLVPRLQHTSEVYNQAIAAQRQENLALQQRLTDLKKDKSLMQQQIARYHTAITQMEASVGL